MNSVSDVETFALPILAVSLAVLLALVANRLSPILRIPTPAIFLVAAAVASDLWPRLGELTTVLDERIVTVALVVILFDGGMSIGWRRFRHVAGPVLWVGVAGTVVTAGGLALAGHVLFGFEWRSALLIGTALAPTDPAVVFSVLSGRDIAGRSGTMLEGESGANDPVGIALLISILGAGGAGLSAVGTGLQEFGLQMVVGGVVGALGGLGLKWTMQHVELPDAALYPLRVIAGGTAIYGIAAVCHGSGFLAVFLAGIIIGGIDAPYRPEVEQFSSALSSLGEIIAFTVLGLTITLGDLFSTGDVLVGLGLAALLIVVIRPLLVGVVLIPVDLRRNERVFILWAGLKGAVPILLGIFLLGSDMDDKARAYHVIFVVVLISVLVQGSSIPAVARRLGIPMREVPPQPYAIGLRLQHPPDNLRRFTIARGSAADGTQVKDLGLDGRAWLNLASRDDELLALSGDTVLIAGDKIVTQADPEADLDAIFDVPKDD